MPIFMDRHDAQDTITAEEVAFLHQEDLKVQDQFGCNVLTYWFDEKRRTAFCLIDAPDANSISQLHNHAHGQVPHQIIEVNGNIVESFLGRIEEPDKQQLNDEHIGSDTAFRLVMCIKLKQLPPLQDDAKLTAELHNFNFEAGQLLKVGHGNLVQQSLQDSLVSFKSVSNAVHTSIKVQSLFSDLKKSVPISKITLKIGLSAGSPVTEKPSLFEDTINLAKRMCDSVKGDITVSADVKELFDSENQTLLDKNKIIFCLKKEDERFLNKLSDYMATVSNKADLKIDDFAREMGYSKSQLYRQTIFLTGKSPNAFITDYRLNNALLLLIKHQDNIAEVAYETGFSSPSYFSKCFIKKYGYNPSRY